MNRGTWKAGERRIAKQFDTNRTPLSGGSSRHTRSDTLHEKLFIEIKHNKTPPGNNLWQQTKDFAKCENKIPLIVFIKKGSSEPILMCKLKDISIINRYIKYEVLS